MPEGICLAQCLSCFFGLLCDETGGVTFTTTRDSVITRYFENHLNPSHALDAMLPKNTLFFSHRISLRRRSSVSSSGSNDCVVNTSISRIMPKDCESGRCSC